MARGLGFPPKADVLHRLTLAYSCEHERRINFVKQEVLKKHRAGVEVRAFLSLIAPPALTR